MHRTKPEHTEIARQNKIRRMPKGKGDLSRLS